MTTTSRFDLQIAAFVCKGRHPANVVCPDILDIGSRSLLLACPLCEHVGAFQCGAVTRSKTRITRCYQCPVCMCEISVTIRIR